MVLAAGLGTRLRPITDMVPKPLVKVASRSLLDHAIDRLIASGVKTVVINTHYLSAQIERHIADRNDILTIISSEKASLLETGGGVKKALGNFSGEPFYVLNADVFWLNGPTLTLNRMAEHWDDSKMDVLLLLHSTVEAYGYNGVGDFYIDSIGKISRRVENSVTPYLFTGIQIIHPRAFEGAPSGAFSLNVIYDKVIEADRLFGIVHDGEWFHIGTPKGLAEADSYMAQRYSGKKHR